MDIRCAARLLILACLLNAASAVADQVILSGAFDGSETEIAPFSGTCDDPDALLGHVVRGPIQVTSTGLYEFTDAGDEVALDVVIRVYADGFDPADVEGGVVASSIDRSDRLPLDAGVAYYVVLQHACRNQAGAYGVSIAGNGMVSGDGLVAAPLYTFGVFEASDDEAEFGLGQNLYDISGPVQVSRSGQYAFADVSRYWRTDVQLWLYQGAFNPEDPSQNAVGFLEDEGVVELEAGTEYYFVTTPRNDFEFGPWQYVLFPPGAPRLNGFFSGSWNSAAVDKQGIMMEVMPEIDFVFFVWFTFAQQPAMLENDGSLPKLQALGGEGQRWISAYGTYVPGASTVALDFQNTTGASFMDSTGVSQDSEYGTGTLIVEDCNNIVIEYDLPSGPVQGSYPVSRVYPDAITVDACEALGNQPGVIE